MNRAISLGSMPEPEKRKRAPRPKKVKSVKPAVTVTPVSSGVVTITGGGHPDVTVNSTVVAVWPPHHPPTNAHHGKAGPSAHRIRQLRKLVASMTTTDMFGKEVTADLLPHGRPLYADASTQCNRCNRVMWYDDLVNGKCWHCHEVSRAWKL